MNIKIITFSALFFMAVCSMFSLVFYFGDWQRLAFVALFGLFFGVMFAPEFEPKKFKRAWLLQMSSGAITGLIVGLAVDYGLGLVVCCAAIGAFVGWLAPGWLKHVPIP